MYKSGTHLYKESTTLITELKATGVQLKPQTYTEWSIALNTWKGVDVDHGVAPGEIFDDYVHSEQVETELLLQAGRHLVKS